MERIEWYENIIRHMLWISYNLRKKIFQNSVDVRVINNSKNGLKINMNCGSTNLEPLKKAMTEIPADIGFSFDGDADRAIGLDFMAMYWTEIIFYFFG